MSSKSHKEVQIDVSRRAEKIAEVLDHGLAGSIAYHGGELTGFSLKIGHVDCLVTLKAQFPAGHMVAWVGAAGMGEVILKCERLAAVGELRWRQDAYKMD